MICLIVSIANHVNNTFLIEKAKVRKRFELSLPNRNKLWFWTNPFLINHRFLSTINFTKPIRWSVILLRTVVVSGTIAIFALIPFTLQSYSLIPI